MPVISVKRDLLLRELDASSVGQGFNQAFGDLCFQFGLELDEVTTEKASSSDNDGDGGGATLFKIDVPANRYDLLCAEGLVRALRVFKGQRESAPRYARVPPVDGAPPQRLVVDREAAAEAGRPHAVAAVLRDVTLCPRERCDSLVELQERLHQTVCRWRSLVAIGTHDLDAVRGPFTYTAKPPEEIRFRALNQPAELTAAELLVLYKKKDGGHHLKRYLPLVEGRRLYPVVLDSDGAVLSMPPVINGERSKITPETRNVLVECTATDLAKAKVVLDIVVAMFSEYCSRPYTVEEVEVVYQDGSVPCKKYPELAYRTQTLSSDYINRRVGIAESAESIARLLTRMCLTSRMVGDESIEVEIPPTRPDVLHACDIVEDAAVAFGFDNVPRGTSGMLVGPAANQFPLNKLTELLRPELAAAGYTEVLTFALCSRDDLGTKLGAKKSVDDDVVHIGNPKAAEFQVVRTTLLPGLLKTVAANKHKVLPLKLFEISDVVLKDAGRDVGAKNVRRLCAVHYDKELALERIMGLLDHVMRLLAVERGGKDGYHLRGTDHPTFSPGQSAKVLALGRSIGWLGTLHPNVVTGFELAHPGAALEIDIEPFL